MRFYGIFSEISYVGEKVTFCLHTFFVTSMFFSFTVRPRKIIKFSMLAILLSRVKKPRVVLGLNIFLDRQRKFKNNYHSAHTNFPSGSCTRVGCMSYTLLRLSRAVFLTTLFNNIDKSTHPTFAFDTDVIGIIQCTWCAIRYCR